MCGRVSGQSAGGVPAEKCVFVHKEGIHSLGSFDLCGNDSRDPALYAAPSDADPAADRECLSSPQKHGRLYSVSAEDVRQSDHRWDRCGRPARGFHDFVRRPDQDGIADLVHRSEEDRERFCRNRQKYCELAARCYSFRVPSWSEEKAQRRHTPPSQGTDACKALSAGTALFQKMQRHSCAVYRVLTAGCGDRGRHYSGLYGDHPDAVHRTDRRGLRCHQPDPELRSHHWRRDRRLYPASGQSLACADVHYTDLCPADAGRLCDQTQAVRRFSGSFRPADPDLDRCLRQYFRYCGNPSRDPDGCDHRLLL